MLRQPKILLIRNEICFSVILKLWNGRNGLEGYLLDIVTPIYCVALMFAMRFSCKMPLIKCYYFAYLFFSPLPRTERGDENLYPHSAKISEKCKRSVNHLNHKFELVHISHAT